MEPHSAQGAAVWTELSLVPGSDLTAWAGTRREPRWLADGDSGERWRESVRSWGRGVWKPWSPGAPCTADPQVDSRWSSSVSLTDAGSGRKPCRQAHRGPGGWQVTRGKGQLDAGTQSARAPGLLCG